MSRSYKKYPLFKAKKSYKYEKKLANKKVRLYNKSINDSLQNCQYKKLYDSYDIHDGEQVEFKEWALRDYEKDQYDIINNVNLYKKKFSLKEIIEMWEASFKRK